MPVLLAQHKGPESITFLVLQQSLTRLMVTSIIFCTAQEVLYNLKLQWLASGSHASIWFGFINANECGPSILHRP